jgi:hypothetical protein
MFFKKRENFMKHEKFLKFFLKCMRKMVRGGAGIKIFDKLEPEL